MAFSVCSLLGRVDAISTCHSLGKIKTQKNPVIKDWITENKKMVDHFCLNWKILPSSNGCKLINYAHRFVISRKYLCFCLFMQQRKIFCSNKTTAIPGQLKNAPKKDSDLRLLSRQVFAARFVLCFLLPATSIYKNSPVSSVPAMRNPGSSIL